MIGGDAGGGGGGAPPPAKSPEEEIIEQLFAGDKFEPWKIPLMPPPAVAVAA